jgi:hypothetical protein
MTPTPPLVEADEAEAQALADAVGESDADPRDVSHERVRAWLSRLANGQFDTPPPDPD